MDAKATRIFKKYKKFLKELDGGDLFSFKDDPYVLYEISVIDAGKVYFQKFGRDDMIYLDVSFYKQINNVYKKRFLYYGKLSENW